MFLLRRFRGGTRRIRLTKDPQRTGKNRTCLHSYVYMYMRTYVCMHVFIRKTFPFFYGQNWIPLGLA